MYYSNLPSCSIVENISSFPVRLFKQRKQKKLNEPISAPHDGDVRLERRRRRRQHSSGVGKMIFPSSSSRSDSCSPVPARLPTREAVRTRQQAGRVEEAAAAAPCSPLHLHVHPIRCADFPHSRCATSKASQARHFNNCRHQRQLHLLCQPAVYWRGGGKTQS